MTYQYILVKSNIVSLQGEFIGFNVIMQKVAELIHHVQTYTWSGLGDSMHSFELHLKKNNAKIFLCGLVNN